MLTRLDLIQFKCFEELHLPLAPLTLLTGLNAAGKSSALQAIVLLHQATIDNEPSTSLQLDGASVSLGSASDIINETTGRSHIGIGLSWNGVSCLWMFRSEDRKAISLPIDHVICSDEDNPSTQFNAGETQFRHLIPTQWADSHVEASALGKALRDLIYIGAERIGPREAYALASLRRPTDVGCSGERTPSVLYWCADERPLEGLLLPEHAPTLERQTEAWMQRFFPGVVLELAAIPRANLVSLGIRTDSGATKRPQNVGYGLTHILPIITACLAAKAGDVLLIENPESHLHPAGQSLMGQFLCTAAAAGIQLIIETHSDHVLNGVRRSVRDSLLRPDQVGINFFAPVSAGIARSQVTGITVGSDGSLDSWPEGFFDQYDKDVSMLAGWSS